MKEKLAALYALQQVDSAIDALKRGYAALDTGAVEKAAYELAHATHAEANADLHRISTEIRDAELEQKQIETKRAEYESKLYGGSVRAVKELQAMQEEIDMLGRQRARLDERILALMEQIETARSHEAERKRSADAARKAMRQKQAGYKHNVEQLQNEARVLAQRRKKAAAVVPADLMKRYEALRTAYRGLAVARLEDNNACSACRMGVPTSLVTSVRAGSAVCLCDNCGRILVSAPEG